MAFINGIPYTGFRGINLQGPNNPNQGGVGTGGYLRFGGTVTASMSNSKDLGVYPLPVGKRVYMKSWNGTTEVVLDPTIITNITTITSTAVLSIDQAGLILCNSAGGSMSITLPAASDVKGLTFTIKKIDTAATDTSRILRAGTDIIDKVGVTSLSDMITQGDFYTLVADGSGTWHVISRRVQ